MTFVDLSCDAPARSDQQEDCDRSLEPDATDTNLTEGAGVAHAAVVRRSPPIISVNISDLSPPAANEPEQVKSACKPAAKSLSPLIIPQSDTGDSDVSDYAPSPSMSPFSDRSPSRRTSNSIALASPTMLAGLKFRIAYDFEGWKTIDGKKEDRHEARGVETWIYKLGGTVVNVSSETVHFLIVPRSWPTTRSSSPGARHRISQYVISSKWLFQSIEAGKLIPPSIWVEQQRQRFNYAAWSAKMEKGALGFPFGLGVSDEDWGHFVDRWASVYGKHMVWLGCDTSNVECRQCWRRYPKRDGKWNAEEERWEGRGFHDVEYVKAGFDRDLSVKKLREFVRYLSTSTMKQESGKLEEDANYLAPPLRVTTVRYPCCIGRFTEHIGELIDHHCRTAKSSDKEFAPRKMADVWRLELSPIKVDDKVEFLIVDQPGNLSRYLHTAMTRGRLAIVSVMQDQAFGVQYIVMVLVAVPVTGKDGTIRHETHMGVNFWPPTARPEDLQTLLLALLDTFKGIVAECIVPFNNTPKLSLEQFASVTHFLWETSPPGLITPETNRTERYIGQNEKAEDMWELLEGN